jgi:hypothetical protein
MPNVTVKVGNDTVTTSYDSRASGPGIVPYESLPQRSSVSATANQVPSVSQVSFLPQTFEFIDFADARSNNYGFGAYFQPQVGGLRGSGVDGTVFRMRPGTSTRAPEIPVQSTGDTNNISLIRIGGGGSIVRSPIISDFTLLGTEQGHLYNGLLVYYSTNGQIMRVKVKHIPGNASSQPGETFGINDYRSNGNVYSFIEIDGDGVGASGFGGNLGSNLTVVDSVSKNNPYSAGWTCNTYSNITYRRVSALDNGKMGFNFERVSGTVLLDNCTMLRNKTYHISIANDQNTAQYTIIDPVFDGAKLNVKVSGFAGNPMKQDINTIDLIVNGVERPDLLNLIRG